MDDTTETETESSEDATCRQGSNSGGGDNGDESDDEDEAISAAERRAYMILREKLMQLYLDGEFFIQYDRLVGFFVFVLPTMAPAARRVIFDFIIANRSIKVDNGMEFPVTCINWRYRCE